MTKLNDSGINLYLNDVEKELRSLPRVVSRGILDAIREELDGASVLNFEDAVQKFGEPKRIVAAATASLQSDPAESPRLSIAVLASLMLMVGAIVIPIAGLIAAGVLVSMSQMWTVREKLFALISPVVISAVVLMAVKLNTTWAVPRSGAFGGPTVPDSANYILAGACSVVAFLVAGTVLLVVAVRRTRRTGKDGEADWERRLQPLGVVSRRADR